MDDSDPIINIAQGDADIIGRKFLGGLPGAFSLTARNEKIKLAGLMAMGLKSLCNNTDT